MRDPLNMFADRLVRGGELEEFIIGLIREKGVSAERIVNSALSAIANPEPPESRLYRAFSGKG